MRIPDNSFFDDLDILGLNNKKKDSLQAEISEETQLRKQELDVFSVEKPADVSDSDPDSDPDSDSDLDSDSDAGVAFNYGMTADWIVRIMDGANKKYLPPLYKRKLYTANEKKLIKQYTELERQGRPFEITVEDERLMDKRDKINALVDAVPLSEDEKNELSGAIAEVMEGANVKVSPMQKLFMTLAIVEGARVLPLFTMKNDVVVE